MNQNPPNYQGNGAQNQQNGAGWNYGYQNVNQQPPYQQQNPYQPVGYQQGMPQQPQYQQNPYQPAGYQQGVPQQPQYQQTPYQPTGYQQGVPQQPQYQQAPYQPVGYQQGVPPYQQNQQPMNTGYQPPYSQMTGVNRSMYGNGYQMGYGVEPMQPDQQGQPARAPFDWKMLAKVVLFGVLPILFALAMFFGAIPALKWVFVGLAVLAVVAMWVKPLVAENTRFTLSAVYGALAIVALVSALTGAAPSDSKATSATGGTGAVTSQNGGSVMQNGDQVITTDTPTPSPTPTPRLSDSETVRQLESFFYFWKNNQIEQMVELCAPSWKSGVQTPNNALFQILANRKVEDYETERISGHDNDVTRTVTIVATISKYTGQEPMKYRFTVVMKKENEMWYVDPNSLDSQEAAEETPTPTPTFTPKPTEYIVVTNSTPLYYNPDGGSKYHSDANCKSANARFLPFKGKFTYGEVNNAPYTDLEPCNRCNAPVRQ